MIPFRKSLAFRLLILSFILLALPLLVDSFIIVQNSYRGAIMNAKRNLVEIAASRSIPLSEMQPAKRLGLAMMEAFLDLREHFPTEPQSDLGEKLRAIAEAGDFSGLFLLRVTQDGNYVVVAANQPAYEKKNYTDFVNLMDIYSSEVYNVGFFSFLAYDSQTLQPYFIVGRVVYSLDNKPQGILMVTLNIADRLEKILAPVEDKYPINFALLLPNTIVFAASDPTLQYQYFVPIDEKFRAAFQKQEVFSKQPLPLEPIPRTTLGYPFFEFTWNGQQQVGYINNLSTSAISLMAYASKQAIFTQPFVDFLDVYVIYLAILIVGGVLAYFLTRRLARPMFHLGNVMLDIQRGNLESRYQSDPLGYEINTVGEIFNKTIEALFQKQTLAEQARVERETYAQELRIGQHVQRSLLVEKTPSYPEVDIAHRYIPAKEVGGDFFDVFIKDAEDGEVLALSIADASGKGVRACFYSLGVRNMLRTYAKEFEDVAHVMERTNALFCLDSGETGMFVTVLMAYYNHRNKEFAYYSCGHNPLLLRKANGEVSFLNHMGIAMGLEAKMDVESHKVKLEKGDLILFYTDGITEAHDIHFRMFSDERLVHFLKKEGDKPASEIADKLLEEVRLFVGTAPQHDDITLLIMKVT